MSGYRRILVLVGIGLALPFVGCGDDSSPVPDATDDGSVGEDVGADADADVGADADADADPDVEPEADVVADVVPDGEEVIEGGDTAGDVPTMLNCNEAMGEIAACGGDSTCIAAVAARVCPGSASVYGTLMTCALTAASGSCAAACVDPMSAACGDCVSAACATEFDACEAATCS